MPKNEKETIDPVGLWVAALRSGKYEQGRTNLNSRNKFCCLGVACEVYQEHVGGLEVKEITNSDGQRVVTYNGHNALTPQIVKSWLGLRDYLGDFDDPIKIDDQLCHTLAGLNDHGKPFTFIADVIESRPAGLFKGGAL